MMYHSGEEEYGVWHSGEGGYVSCGVVGRTGLYPVA